jgi:hypothetical protein
MRFYKLALGAAILAVGVTGHTPLSGSSAQAANVARMKAVCRARASNVMRYRLPDISTKYEGQRVNGTHAVNGTARSRGRSHTFQCSFNRSGQRIIRFVVN